MFRLIFLIALLPVALFGSTIPHPQVFVANQGQWPSAVLYGATTSDVSVWITKTGMILDQTGLNAAGTRQHQAVTFDVIGATGRPTLDVTRPVSGPSVSMFRKGSSATALATASSVVVRDVRPGVHVEYVWDNGAVRYNILVDPGTALPSPLFRVTGSDGLATTADGFSCKTTLGSISMSGLAAYSNTPDRERSVMPIARGSEIGFVVADRTMAEALTVDPIVSATAIHGSGNQVVTSMVLDRNGNVVVGGSTNSFDIEIPSGGARPIGQAGTDGFVACFTPDLKTILAWSYITGDSNEAVRSIAVSPLGDIWVTGESNSTDLPVSAGKGGKFSGVLDGFVFRFSADLKTILAGKYLAGNKEDRPLSITCNLSGDVLICGQTRSTAGISVSVGHDLVPNGGWDAFVLKIERTGSDVEHFTYFGSPGDDAFTTIIVDPAGNTVVAGWTGSNEFETFPVKTRVWVADPKDYYYGGHYEDVGSNPYDVEYNGGSSDAVAAKFSSEGILTFSTYFGGKGEDKARRVLADKDNRITIIGTSLSSDLPLPEGSSAVYHNKADVFMFGLSSDGLRLTSCSYFGGNGDDDAADACFDAAGNVMITGSTTSTDLPQTGSGTTNILVGADEGFLAVITSSEVLYSTVFGWTGSDMPTSMARDARGDVFIAGTTTSTLPGQAPSTNLNGFVAKWAFGTLAFRNPPAGTTFCTGSQVNVSWLTEDIAATSTYDVDYSTDMGNSWLSAAKGLKTKSYSWTVPAQRPDSGSVWLRVISTNGHTSLSPSPYVVESAPTYATQPSSGTFCPGSNITLAPEVVSTTATYQWRKNGTPISGATQRTLTISSAQTADAGSYDLVATSACGASTSSAAIIAVSAQPIISSQPQSANVADGGSVTLRVKADGEALTYQWNHNGSVVSGATSDSLELTGLTKAQEGKYRCVIGSACGSSTSNDATIIVGTTSIDDEETANVLFISPQPASDIVTVTTPFTMSVSSVINVYNVDGINVGRLSGITSTSASSFTLSLGHLPTGVYSLVVSDGTTSLRQLLMISR
ncbi:MAG: immunoglobulin domain-containing protein [Ignavibacteria bacterium]|nr:immunoglobulin domain-containing protein [Ignavibacteria bacterium]